MTGPAKVRLDRLLVERGLADSGARAQALVLAGRVFRGEERLDKAGLMLAADTLLRVRAVEEHVGRGAHKLIAGLDAFAIDPSGETCLDVGASTGGFTDVLLRRGAARVYAVDVGYGQLDARLRADPRVVVLERTNARHLTAEQVPEPIGLVVCDASFISLRTVLPAPLALTRPGAALVALIKPQFEVGKGRVGKGGVVRDPALHQEVCAGIRDWIEGLPGWQVLGVVESPLLGPAGNREFLIGARAVVTSGTLTRMLFKRAILEGIAAGTVTLAFRRWRRPTVRAGGRLRTAVGVLAIQAVEAIEVEAIQDADAAGAGFPTRAALLAELRTGDDGQTSVYRVAVRLAGPDPRLALREAAELDGETAAAVRRSLARLDQAGREGAWTHATLALIQARPGVRAADLAQALGRDKAALKRGIRKLKELGLTESLDIGYRLAPRGRAYLEVPEPGACPDDPDRLDATRRDPGGQSSS